jgi:hypothetical protein
MSGIRYRAGFKYQLAEAVAVETAIRPPKPAATLYVQLDPDGTMFIKSGYAWDGPSGPTVDTPSAMRGSLVHDALYQLIRLGLLAASFRAAADAEYRRLCLADGMWPIRAALHFDALRLFGGSSAAPSAERPILTAP